LKIDIFVNLEMLMTENLSFQNYLDVIWVGSIYFLWCILKEVRFSDSVTILKIKSKDACQCLHQQDKYAQLY